MRKRERVGEKTRKQKIKKGWKWQKEKYEKKHKDKE